MIVIQRFSGAECPKFFAMKSSKFLPPILSQPYILFLQKIDFDFAKNRSPP